MSDRSRIEWTDATWNPVSGCTRVSPGCDHCYARRMAERFRGVPGHAFECGFSVRCRPDRLRLPSGWRRPRRIFVDSMGDLFHSSVPTDYIGQVFAVMRDCPWHTFQVLTKRSGRALSLATRLPWPANVWMGVSVEDAARLVRLEHLRAIPAAVRFVSFEPLLGFVAPDLSGLHWVIAGGETGPGARACRLRWVRQLRDQCAAARIPFFFKGSGGRRPPAVVHGRERVSTYGERTLDGRRHEDFPA